MTMTLLSSERTAKVSDTELIDGQSARLSCTVCLVLNQRCRGVNDI